MKGPDVKLVRRGMHTATSGLAAYNHPEVSASVADDGLRSGVDEILRWIADYVRDRRAKLRPGEYLRWGYWHLRFLQRGDGLEIHEAEPDGRGFRPGVTRTLNCHREQKAACRRLRSLFSPPPMDSEARVTPSVLEGAFPLRARRELAAPPSSGWRFAADGDTPDDLTEIRLCEVSAARPEILPYLALVDGFEVVLDEDGERRAEYVEEDDGAG